MELLEGWCWEDREELKENYDFISIDLVIEYSIHFSSVSVKYGKIIYESLILGHCMVYIISSSPELELPWGFCVGAYLLTFVQPQRLFFFFLDKWNDVEMCIVGEPILLSAV